MKLHLAPRATIHSAPPQHPVLVHGGLFLHYASPYVYVTEIETHRVVQKLRYEDVQAIRIHNDRLYICTSDVYVLDMDRYEIREVLRLSKALVGHIEFDGGLDGQGLPRERFMVSKVDRRLYIFEDFKRVGELASHGFCDKLLIGGPLCGYLDKERLVVYRDGASAVDNAIENIVCAFLAGGGVYTVDEAGVLKEWISGREVELDVEAECASFFNGRLHVSSGHSVYEYGLDGTPVRCTDVGARVAEYCGDCVADCDESVKEVKPSEEGVCSDSTADESGGGDAAFEYFDGSVIQAPDTGFIVHDNFNVLKIICFNDDITDSVRYGDFLLISTAAGNIAYTRVDGYVEGEYLFDGRVVRCHGDSVTGMALFQNYVLTGSRDKTAALWQIEAAGARTMHLRRLKVLARFIEPISAVAFAFGLVAIASLDNIIQVCNARQNRDTGCDLETVLVQQIHTKQINHISITPGHIITSSSDKTAKVFSHSGEELKVLSSDKILHTSYNTDYVALCSHKAIKMYDHAFNQVATFQIKKPVLSSCFYGGFFLGISDVLRVYDVGRSKCVKSYDLGVASCWSLAFPILCGENKIVFLEDESERVNTGLLDDLRAAKEESLLVGKYCRESRFEEALAIVIRKNDYKKMFRIVCDGFYARRSLDFLGAFAGCRSKLLEMLVQNPGLKQSEIFNLMVEAQVCGTQDPVRKDKLHAICRKHYDSLDRMYTTLLSLDIYEER